MNRKMFENTAGDYLLSSEGQKILEKKQALEKLAGSVDGQKMKDMLGGENIEAAAKSGDIAALAEALQKALKTGEGERFVSQLKELMK